MLATIYPFPNKPWFLRVYSEGLSNTLWEKEKLLVTVFSTCWRTFFHFHQSENYHLQTLQVWKGLNFVIWGRVNYIVFTTQSDF